MTSGKSNGGVHAFFKSYCASFETLNVDAIADHFAYPSHITSDAEEVALIPIANRQDADSARCRPPFRDDVAGVMRPLLAPIRSRLSAFAKGDLDADGEAFPRGQQGVTQIT